MSISIVTTLFHSAKYIDDFYRRILVAVTAHFDDVELIFVDDGSPDNSLQIIKDIAVNDDRIKIIELSRNFGHHKAILLGLEHATGDYIFLIDCDLEEPPEIFSDFYNYLKSEQADAICGYQEFRKGGLLERVSGGAAWKIVEWLANMPIQRNLVTARLMTKEYVDAILTYKDRDVFLAGICYDIGFTQKFLPIKKGNTSKSSYSLLKRFQLFISGIVGFSSAPLYFSLILGFLCLTMAIIASFYFMYLGFMKISPVGYASTALLISFWGGAILIGQGIQGIYLAKIFTESKNRPLAVVRKVTQKNHHDK